MDTERRARFKAWFEQTFPGPDGRARFMALFAQRGHSITKGRVSQLFDEKEPFGERAARSLEEKLGLERGLFDRAEPAATAQNVQPVSGSRPDYAESISDTLGDSLMTLHGEMSRRAVDALGVLARAPDSPRARGELMDVLQHAKLEALAGEKQRISLELVAAQLRGAYAAALKLEPKPSPEEFVKGFMDALSRHNH